RPIRIGSGMMVSSGPSFTPPCLMISTIERNRCWFVPIRPVTPFMIMPTVCCFMGLIFRSFAYSICTLMESSSVLLICGDNLPQEIGLVTAPEFIREYFDFVKSVEARFFYPSPYLSNGDTTFPHKSAIVQHVSRGDIPITDMECVEVSTASASFDFRFQGRIPPKVVHVDGNTYEG